jgi:hypothetical protein
MSASMRAADVLHAVLPVGGVLASTDEGLLVAVTAGGSVEEHHSRGALHGHLKLVPSPTLLATAPAPSPAGRRRDRRARRRPRAPRRRPAVPGSRRRRGRARRAGEHEGDHEQLDQFGAQIEAEQRDEQRPSHRSSFIAEHADHTDGGLRWGVGRAASSSTATTITGRTALSARPLPNGPSSPHPRGGQQRAVDILVGFGLGRPAAYRW